MKTNSLIFFIALFSIIGCRSFSKYPIDEQPQINLDTSLLGIWKIKEDTNRYDYFLVQDCRAFKGVIQPVDDYYYINDDRFKDRFYYLTRMDHNGRNPHYHQFYSFLSHISGEVFLNISYRYAPVLSEEPFKVGKHDEGYFFLRLIEINKNSLTAAIVADTALKYLTSTEEVRKRIEANINAPSFYRDTLHYYKISSFYSSIEESKKIANSIGRNKTR